MSARKIDFFIESSDGVRALKAQLDRLFEIQQFYESVAPEGLGQFSKVSYSKGETLHLTADNGAVAVKLKQLLPNLLEQFRKRGFEITAIRIEVQVQNGRNAPGLGSKAIRLSPSAFGTLTQLTREIEPGELKTALSTMLARHSKR